MIARQLADLSAELQRVTTAVTRDIPPTDRPWRALFSRSGFHPELQEEAALPDNRILLIDLARLYTP